jgi:hypothetical protein
MLMVKGEYSVSQRGQKQRDGRQKERKMRESEERPGKGV